MQRAAWQSHTHPLTHAQNGSSAKHHTARAAPPAARAQPERGRGHVFRRGGHLCGRLGRHVQAVAQLLDLGRMQLLLVRREQHLRARGPIRPTLALTSACARSSRVRSTLALTSTCPHSLLAPRRGRGGLTVGQGRRRPGAQVDPTSRARAAQRGRRSQCAGARLVAGALARPGPGRKTQLYTGRGRTGQAAGSSGTTSIKRRRRIIAKNIAANDRSAARRCSASVWRRSLRAHAGAQRKTEAPPTNGAGSCTGGLTGAAS
jgi:hypothetical protein